jgi:hypothetical protein
MTTARDVITGALTFHLNRLSPGESADADTLAVCLSALNDIADEWNGSKAFLFREILTASGSAISAATALLGTAWATLSPGDQILGATYAASGQDNPMRPLTMQQYHEQVFDKTATGEPDFWAHDGLATVYFYPVPTGHTITLRTHQVVSDFADLDTDYSMPKGYKSALSACLSEKLAPTMNPQLLGECQRKARAARSKIAAQAIEPAIINGAAGRPSILRGW